MLVTLTVSSAAMAPPEAPAESSLNVDPVTVSRPRVRTAPPWPRAELFVKVALVIWLVATSPLAEKAPPAPLVPVT